MRIARRAHETSPEVALSSYSIPMFLAKTLDWPAVNVANAGDNIKALTAKKSSWIDLHNLKPWYLSMIRRRASNPGIRVFGGIEKLGIWRELGGLYKPLASRRSRFFLPSHQLISSYSVHIRYC